MQVYRYGLGIIATTLLASCSGPEAEPELYPDSLFENPPASDTGAIAELRGRWVSEENTDRELEISGHEFVRFEKAVETSRGPAVFVKDCSTGSADPDGEAFVVKESGEKTCYIMSSVTEDKLVFIHGKRGRMFRFTRRTEE
ncbi:hypothetical protein SAMN02745824_3229 [Parasphingorhabdus marina DSM 22363]|uniref:Uncharacterized protein n=1 Tax=Parasphingorhabdus marina DSM 22363 TaxID=1123272 RepID=A0A1N6HCE1_9SPHN|nr:hypothetical protein [Parasphingorhabdus marina]SIO17488.1 hypothetical protein SAMN02745824_3229 [Parasphingorhabdus marina DSM 22363]